MGAFVLSRIKRQKGSLLLRTRPRSPTDTIIKPPTKEEEDDTTDDNTDDASYFNNATSITAVTYESSFNDDSTLSSIHSDSLTSFAGNLSPPEIEFHEDLLDNTKEEDAAAAVVAVRRQERQNSATLTAEEQLSKRKDDGGGRQRGRQLLATSSKKYTNADNQSKNKVKVKPVSPAAAVCPPSKPKTDITPLSKSKTDIATPAKKTIRTAIIGPSIPITSIPSIIINTSSLMEDFNPTVEIGQEMNDEKNTVITMEILEGMISMMHLFGIPLECIDTFKKDDVAEEDGTAMASLFDDEGNQFTLERKHQGTGPDVTENSMASDSNRVDKSHKGSDKEGTEIIIRKRHQFGSIVFSLEDYHWKVEMIQCQSKGFGLEDCMVHEGDYGHEIHNEEDTGGGSTLHKVKTCHEPDHVI